MSVDGPTGSGAGLKDAIKRRAITVDDYWHVLDDVVQNNVQQDNAFRH